MGGHTKIPKVPDYRIYSKPEEIPYLKKLQDDLAKRGLKDPWIRNYVWRYNPKFGTPVSRLCDFFFRGFLRVGLPAFLITVAYEELVKKKDDHHGAGHH